MFLNKVLSNSRHVLSRTGLPVRVAGPPVRQSHVTVVPAKTPMSAAELWGYGVLLGAATWFYPFWILYHIPDYQNEDRNVYTGK